jgi:hypothetical protein
VNPVGLQASAASRACASVQRSRAAQSWKVWPRPFSWAVWHPEGQQPVPLQQPLTHVSTGHRHVPETHCWSGPQTVPHAPQLSGSALPFTQTPPHWSDGQTHSLATQTRPPPQEASHAPQCCWLVAVFTHSPPHSVSPAGHAQAPETQT